jgi:hypothetical protein
VAICPAPQYFGDNVTNTCLDCDFSCVNLTMKLYFKNNLKTTLVLDLIFTEDLSWSPADVQAFALMSEDDPLIDIPLQMDVTYSIVSPKIYRV